LTEALVRDGHEVTLYASEDSDTSARLVPGAARGLRLDPTCVDPVAPHIAMLEQVTRDAGQYDVIHCHVDYLAYPFMSRWSTPALSTLHGRLDLEHLLPVYEQYTDVAVVSISDAQRHPLPWLPWCGTVYHGLPLQSFRGVQTPGDYLAFLGRICHEKRPDRAVAIARRSGLPLRLAAKIDANDADYYKEIESLFHMPGIDLVGEIAEADKQAFLGNARALLFPIDWPEPFGLAMIEALACGTPVIAYPCGSVPEIIEHGVTGFVVSSIEEAVAAVESLDTIDRRVCRQVFEERFGAPRMAEDYLKIYEALIGAHDSRRLLGGNRYCQTDLMVS
jgi:glycosyltransferase involved in cell wall biosynthesis